MPAPTITTFMVAMAVIAASLTCARCRCFEKLEPVRVLIHAVASRAGPSTRNLARSIRQSFSVRPRMEPELRGYETLKQPHAQAPKSTAQSAKIRKSARAEIHHRHVQNHSKP